MANLITPSKKRTIISTVNKTGFIGMGGGWEFTYESEWSSMFNENIHNNKDESNRNNLG